MKEILLTTLRKKETDTAEFRYAADRLAELLASEATLSIEKQHFAIETPLAPAQGSRALLNVVLVPVLRSGMVLLPPFLRLFPHAKVGFFGIKRDEKTAEPLSYYENLPSFSGTDQVFLLDPMVATGGTALFALKTLSERGVHPSRLTLISIIGSVEGLSQIKKKYPYLTVHIAAEDPSLNREKYIVPGLGDFGNRYFNGS